MYGACALHFGYLKLQTDSQNMQYLLLFPATRLHERVSMLRYTYFSCLFILLRHLPWVFIYKNLKALNDHLICSHGSLRIPETRHDTTVCQWPCGRWLHCIASDNELYVIPFQAN